MKRLKIGQKALLAMLAVAVPALLTFSLFIIGSTESILRGNISRQIRQLTAKSAQSLDDLVRRSRQALTTIATGPDVRSLLRARQRGDEAASRDAVLDLEETLLEFQKLDPTIQAIRLVDEEGRVLIKVREGKIIPRKGPAVPGLGLPAINSIESRDFFQGTMLLGPGETWISNLERGRVEGEEKWCPAMVRFSTPLFMPDGSRAGALVINVWGETAGTMINRLISQVEGAAFLVERNPGDPERNGIYLFHHDRTCEFGNQTGSRLTVFQQYPEPITRAWMEQDEGVLIHPESSDILAHKYYSPYGREDRGWVVVVKAKKSFFMAPLATIKERIFWQAGLVLLLAVAAASFFSRSLVRPLRAVIDGTRRIGADLSSRIDLRSRDEVGFLAGEIDRMAASLQRNIEEKRQMEQQACHAEKLASIGEMAAGLAHELNTPLSNIRALAVLAKKDLDEGRCDREELDRDLAEIANQTQKCGAIITGLLSFARKQNPDWGLLDVNALIAETLSLVRIRQEKSGIRIDFTPNGQRPFIKGDGHQLQQVFVNILLNAFDAVGPGGSVEISAAVEAGRVAIRFRDDGAGIAEEHRHKIFDPFFTTKEVGKGTGLGLSVSYGIVKNQGGTIEVESAPGAGSTFTVSLPVGEY